MKINIHYILIFFLITISIILNLNIDMKLKCYFLLIGIILCFYKTLLIIPFSISIYSIFLLNKHLFKKTNTIETFEENKDTDNTTFISIINNKTPKKTDFDNKISAYKEIVFLNKLFDDKILNSEKDTDKENDILIRNKILFLRDTIDCYFLDLHKIHLLSHYKNFKSLGDLYNYFEFGNNKLKEKYIEINNYSKVFNILDILGIYFYKSNNINKNKFILNIIKELGFYGIINNQYQFSDLIKEKSYKLLSKTPNKHKDYIKQFKIEKTEYTEKYKNIKKYIYEFAILIFYYKFIPNKNSDNKDNKDNIYYNFDSIYDFNKQDQDYSNKKSYINLFEAEYNDKKILIDTIMKNTNFIDKKLLALIKNIFEFDFHLDYTADNKHILQSIDTSNIDFTIPKNIDSLEEKDFNTLFIKNFKLIRDNLDNMNILNEYSLRSIDRDIILKFSIYNNLSILYFLSIPKFILYIETILINNKKDILIKLFQNDYKEILEQQFKIETNEKNKQPFRFTDITDIFFDNLFYYLQLIYKDKNFLKIYKKNTIFDFIKIYKKTPVEIYKTPSVSTETDDNEQVSQLTTFEQDMDRFFNLNEKMKKNKEADLTKFYDILKNEEYIDYKNIMKPLNDLGNKQNKEIESHKQSFEYKIDNFGTNIFKIIDEIKDLLEKFDFTKDLSSYVILLYNIYLVLIKEDRILYSGFIILIIAFFIYFIENENYKGEDIKNVKNMFDILKL